MEDYDNTEGLIAFDDYGSASQSYHSTSDSESDDNNNGLNIGSLPETDVENINLLYSIFPYMDVRELRALGRTSRGLWKELNKIWDDEFLWKNKIERHIGYTLPSDMKYHDWRFVYHIIRDGNLQQLFTLGYPSMTKLALMLGADPNKGNITPLMAAIQSNDIDTIEVLLTDRRVDPDRYRILKYLSTLEVGSPIYERLIDLI